MATIDRVCPLTFFRVTTDSSGDIKRQFKNDWTMTHDTCAIDVDLFEKERETERGEYNGRNKEEEEKEKKKEEKKEEDLYGTR